MFKNAADALLFLHSESDQTIFLKPALKICQKVQFIFLNIIFTILKALGLKIFLRSY
jgi:hypothetical protein